MNGFILFPCQEREAPPNIKYFLSGPQDATPRRLARARKQATPTDTGTTCLAQLAHMAHIPRAEVPIDGLAGIVARGTAALEH